MGLLAWHVRTRTIQMLHFLQLYVFEPPASSCSSSPCICNSFLRFMPLTNTQGPSRCCIFGWWVGWFGWVAADLGQKSD